MEAFAGQKPFLRMLLCCMLAALLACGLSGCKYSDVLTEHIEDPVNGVLDENAEPVYQETPGAPEDPTRVSAVESDNDNQAEQENTAATYSEEPNTDQQTEQREHDEVPDDYEATEGDQQGADGDATVTGERVGEGSGPGDGTSEDGASAGNGTNPTPEEGTSPTPNDSAGAGGPAQVYDTTGPNASIPTDVSTVAATGQYAIIVQMLAGQGALLAADETTLSALRASTAFPGEGLENVAVGWAGDGTAAGSIDVQAVVASGADCVVSSATGTPLSAEEQQALLDGGVSVVVGPDLGAVDTPDANITQAVQLVGELLRGSPACAYDTAAAAQQYVQMHDAAIQACVDANGGYSYKYVNNSAFRFIYQGTDVTGTQTTQLASTSVATAFVNGWTSVPVATVNSQRSYSRVSMDYLGSPSDVLDCSDGVGLGTPGSATGNFPLLAYYLQCSGVIDNAYEGAKPASSATPGMSAPPSAVVAGGTLNMGLEGLITSRGTPSALWFSQVGDQDDENAWTTVGDAAFPGVIVRNEDIAGALLASAGKVNGYYNVGQPYLVYVMPSGLAGSWADGTVESFLAAPWAYGCFRSGNDLSSASTYVNDFYQTFYRCSADGVLRNFSNSGLLVATCPTS